MSSTITTPVDARTMPPSRLAPSLPEAGGSPWRYRLAVATMLATFLLIVAGGNVTTKDAGLAVPDWPLSFGSLNPEGWTAEPGVRDEHGHRLIGATVGAMLTVLAVWTCWRDPRRAVVRLAIVAWVAVVIQGVMGGLRVTELSIELAVIHGCFAHAFFCLMVAFATVNSPRWLSPSAADTVRPAASLPRALTILLAVLFGQLILGATLRHTGTGTAWHIAGSLVIGFVLAWVLNLIFSQPAAPWVRRRLLAVLALYFVQLALGLATLLVVDPRLGYTPADWMRYYLPTVHVAVGALIMAISFHVALWQYRQPTVPETVDTPTGEHEQPA